jgi:hypothetical protein
MLEKAQWLSSFRSVGLHLTLDDFQKVSDQVPFLADLKPSGKYVMEDLHKVMLNGSKIHLVLSNAQFSLSFQFTFSMHYCSVSLLYF